MAADEYVGKMGIYKLEGFEIISSGVSSYVHHKDSLPFKLKELYIGVGQPHAVVVTVAVDSPERLECCYGICCLKVLGAGCKSCHDQYEYAKKAVENLALKVEVEYITDMEKIMEFGVMRMPAIVVNDKVVSAGKVLKVAEVEKLLKG